MNRALAVLIIALVLPATAHARSSNAPGVPGVSVVYGPCPLPATEFSDGCTWDGAAVVYVSGPTHRETLYHEMGHQFAFRAFGDHAERPMAGPMLKFAHTTRRVGEGGRSHLDVREQFADAYAACALGYRPTGNEWGEEHFPSGNDYNPTAREHRAVCAMIWRAAARRGW